MSSESVFAPDYATPPGLILQEVMEEKNLTLEGLSASTGMSEAHLQYILVGKEAITEWVAERLEPVTGISIRMWTNMEAGYREDLRRLDKS